LIAVSTVLKAPFRVAGDVSLDETVPTRENRGSLQGIRFLFQFNISDRLFMPSSPSGRTMPLSRP
jgi:hypothetical protein